MCLTSLPGFSPAFMVVTVLRKSTVYFAFIECRSDVLELAPLHASAELKQTQAFRNGEHSDDGALCRRTASEMSSLPQQHAVQRLPGHVPNRETDLSVWNLVLSGSRQMVCVYTVLSEPVAQSHSQLTTAFIHKLTAGPAAVHYAAQRRFNMQAEGAGDRTPDLRMRSEGPELQLPFL